MIQLKLSKEQREQISERIQAFIFDEHQMEIGSVAADRMLAFFIESIGPYVYNEAIKDARKSVTESMLALEDELYTLEKLLK